MYDAANAIDRDYTPYHAHPVVRGRASLDAAVATAARDTLVGLFPAFTSVVDAQYAASLAAIREGRAKAKGIAVGQSVAADLLAHRANDGRGVDLPEYYVPLPAGAGVWVPVAGRGVLPWIGHMRPFTLERADQFVPGPPPALTSDDYARRRTTRPRTTAGRTPTVRTPAQTNLALFMTEPPPRQWNRLAREPDRPLRRAGRRPGAPLRDDERVRRRCRGRLLDREVPATSCGVRRPRSRPRFDDGNPATTTDRPGRRCAPTPNYADYPSGHACVTGASMAVLRTSSAPTASASRSSSVSAETPATGLIDDTLEFQRFSDVARAVQDARVYLGIHFRFAQVAGDRVGRKTAHWVADHAFQPRDCRGGRCHGRCDDDD